MRVESTELVDAPAIAAMRDDITAGQVRVWRSRGKLPAPVQTGALGQVTLWRRSDIEKFLSEQ